MAVVAWLLVTFSMLDAESRDERGSSAAEYALITVGILVGLLAAVQVWGAWIAARFTSFGGIIGI